MSYFPYREKKKQTQSNLY